MNADVLTSCSSPFFPRARFSREINTAPTRAHYAAPGIYSFGIKEKKEKEKKEEKGKKISHKEQRVKWFKVGKNGLRKADSLQSVSRSVRAAWEAERIDETRRKDDPSKMGIHRRKSWPPFWIYVRGTRVSRLLVDSKFSWICWGFEGVNRHRYWVNRMKNKSGMVARCFGQVGWVVASKRGGNERKCPICQ